MTEARGKPHTGGTRRARMSDVARIAGVSAMTVSRALRNPKTVTAETLQRIEAAVAETRYLPDRVAGSLSSRRTNVVGMIVPSLRNSLFVETIQGVADMLEPEFDLLIADSGYSLKGEEDAIMAFLSQRVCGIVLHNTKHTSHTRTMVKEAGIACVETGNLVRQPIDMAVGFSNHDAAFAMTSHLIERKYRRIGFVSLPLKDNDRASERRAGYLAALQQNGIKPVQDWILESPPGFQNGGTALVKLAEMKKPPDAVFLAGDVLASGAVLEANRRGWKIPDRIAIAGSDDNELQACVSPPLTTLRFPRYEIGRRAAGLLRDRLQGSAHGPVVMDLGYEIIQRESA